MSELSGERVSEGKDGGSCLVLVASIQVADVSTPISTARVLRHYITLNPAQPHHTHTTRRGDRGVDRDESREGTVASFP